jgi:hypothetical protein
MLPPNAGWSLAVAYMIQVPAIPIEISRRWSDAVEQSEDLLDKGMAKVYESKQALSNFQEEYARGAQHPAGVMTLQDSEVGLSSAWDDFECLAAHIRQLFLVANQLQALSSENGAVLAGISPD